jgi:hypothetical protein
MFDFLLKIKKKGFKWFLKRVEYELMSPKFMITKFIVKKIEYLRSAFGKYIKVNTLERLSDDIIYVVYDLNYTAITFDFAHFLAAADSYGKTKDRDKIFLIFIQKKFEPLLMGEINNIVSAESQKWRFNNIVLQLVQIYPKCIGYTFLPNDKEILKFTDGKIIYPEGYSKSYKPGIDYKEIFKIINLKLFDGFHASQQGLNYIQAWMKSQNILNRMVVITIRQYGYDPTRNSNIQEWVKFAHWAKDQKFTVVFVPDTDSCWLPNELLNDFIVFNEPCWNLGLRMALNELAFVNLFSYNGPAAICTLNFKVRSIVFFPIIEESLEANSFVISQFGLTEGQRRYNFSELHQFLSWKRDNFENIKNEFIEFNQLVDSM